MIIFHVKHRLHPSWKKEGKKRGVYPWLKVEETGSLMPLRVLSQVTGQQEIKHLEVFRLKILALAIDRAPATIRLWQKSKLFPAPVIRDKDGKKLGYYSAAQVINMHKVFYYKYKGRTHLHEREEFYEMLSMFRTILDVKYVDRFIVDDEGNINVQGNYSPKDPTAPKGDIHE